MKRIHSNDVKKKLLNNYNGLFLVIIFILNVMQLNTAAATVSVRMLSFSNRVISFPCGYYCGFHHLDRHSIFKQRTTTSTRMFSLMGNLPPSSLPPSNNISNNIEDLHIEEILVVLSSKDSSVYSQAENLKKSRQSIDRILPLERGQYENYFMYVMRVHICVCICLTDITSLKYEM